MMITQDELLTKDSSPTGREQSVPGRPFSVLLAEDDRALRRYLQVVLERAGYEVTSACDGLEAMRVALNDTVDLVITDAMMPYLNGYELCRFLRNCPKLSQLPIVLLSARERSEAPEAEQVDAFLAKPVSPEKLLECLEELLKVRR